MPRESVEVEMERKECAMEESVSLDLNAWAEVIWANPLMCTPLVHILHVHQWPVLHRSTRALSVIGVPQWPSTAPNQEDIASLCKT